MLTRKDCIKKLAFSTLAMAFAPTLLAKKVIRDINKTGKIVIRKDDCILYYGDSITDGNRNNDNLAVSNPNAMGGGYALSTSSTLACKYPNMGLKFWNRGINGNKTSQMIDRLDRDCLNLKFKPTVVSLLTGINDYSLSYAKTGKGDVAKYEADLRQLLTLITTKLPGVKLLVMEPYAIGGVREKTDNFLPGFFEYQPVTRKLAAEFNAVFIPLQSIFDEACQRMGKEKISRDGIHPWAGGVELISRAWLDAVYVDEQ